MTDTTRPAEPATEAGRALLSAARADMDADPDTLLKDILAIEAEARAEASVIPMFMFPVAGDQPCPRCQTPVNLNRDQTYACHACGAHGPTYPTERERPDLCPECGWVIPPSKREAALEAALETIKRKADPGVMSGGPYDERGERLTSIFIVARAALAEGAGE